MKYAPAIFAFAQMANAECERFVNGTQTSCQTSFSPVWPILGYVAFGLVTLGASSCGIYKLYQYSRNTENPSSEVRPLVPLINL